MEIPILTKFINGLKLFFESKRLRWLTLIFLIGAFFIYALERIVVLLGAGGNILTFLGAMFPFFFLVTAILSLAGLQRFVASDESYVKSLLYTVIWLIASVVLLIISLLLASGVMIILVFLGFFTWIAFQGYFSTRTSLSYATKVEVSERSRVMNALLGVANIFDYVIIVGAAIATVFLYLPEVPSTGAIVGAVVGVGIAAIFNFLNGLIIRREQNRQTAVNLTVLGLFISLYSGYFIYSVLKPVSVGIDIVSLLITVFFLLYTMSSVGTTLASRAELDTRWKLTKELAATFTFFLASCYVYVDVMFTALASLQGANPHDIAPVSAILKLWLFPLIALVMELAFIRRSRKVTAAPEVPKEPEATPTVPQGPSPEAEEEPQAPQEPSPEVETEEMQQEESQPVADEAPVPVEGEEAEEEDEPDVEDSSDQSALEPSDDDSGPKDSGESDSSEENM